MVMCNVYMLYDLNYTYTYTYNTLLSISCCSSLLHKLSIPKLLFPLKISASHPFNDHVQSVKQGIANPVVTALYFALSDT